MTSPPRAATRTGPSGDAAAETLSSGSVPSHGGGPEDADKLVVVVSALAVVVLIPLSRGTPHSAATLALAAVAAGAALAAARVGRQSSFTAMTGLLLTAGFLATIESGSQLSRWVTLAALPTVCPLAGLAVLRSPRLATWLLAAGAVLAGPARAMVYDPFLDPSCSGCSTLPAVLPLQSAASSFALVGGSAVVAGMAAGVWRDAAGRPQGLGVLMASGWALSGWSDPRGTVPAAAQLAALVAVVAAAHVLVRILTTRAQLHRLAEALKSGTGPRDGLRRALRDPSLTVDFASGQGDWVDVAGAASLGAAVGTVTTPVRVGDAVLARVHHRPDGGRTERLAATLTTEMRLAVEHAALTAKLHAQVRQLRESRLRLVETADHTRRQLERDLHDGAQQALLALGFDVRRAQAAAPDDPRLTQCVAEVSAALDDLRRLASGVYPALLTDAGLGPALDSLGTSVQHPVRITGLPQGRFTAAVERTVYLLVIDLAACGSVDLDGRVGEGWLHLVAHGPALPARSVVRERIDALGGTLTEDQGTVEVRLPCG